MDIEKEENEIRRKLIKRGHANKVITYSEFLKLYEKYKGEMSERNFAEILGIKYARLNRLQQGDCKIKILIEKNRVTDERVKEIQDIVASGNYVGKSISYADFLEFYESYKNEMTERQFATILEISYDSFTSLKRKKDPINAKILKSRKPVVTEERAKQIRESLRKRGYENLSLNYQEFLRLYYLFKSEMTEQELAKILDVSYDSLNYARKRKGKVTILKPLKKEANVDDKRKKYLQDLLMSMGYVGKSISYDEFLNIYAPYKLEMSEKEFAENILEIGPSTFKALKNGQRHARIIKSRKKETSNERKEEIKKELLNKGYENKLITYEEFLKLYKCYKKEMCEEEFSHILGINETTFRNFKKASCKAKILSNINEKKIATKLKKNKRIVYLFSDSKFYDMEYFKNVSKEYNCTIQEIFNIIYHSSSTYATLTAEALNKKGQVFL